MIPVHSYADWCELADLLLHSLRKYINILSSHFLASHGSSGDVRHVNSQITPCNMKTEQKAATSSKSGALVPPFKQHKRMLLWQLNCDPSTQITPLKHSCSNTWWQSMMLASLKHHQSTILAWYTKFTQSGWIEAKCGWKAWWTVHESLFCYAGECSMFWYVHQGAWSHHFITKEYLMAEPRKWA